jgi:hypothetical protein
MAWAQTTLRMAPLLVPKSRSPNPVSLNPVRLRRHEESRL